MSNDKPHTSFMLKTQRRPRYGPPALAALITPRATATEIARACGVSRQAVGAWARGEYEPGEAHRRVLRERFGIVWTKEDAT
jgi:transcriptional regulator with XRE-family HTH domain